jgi:hypothetical protein
MSEKTAKGNALARGERLQIMVDGDELSAIDDFRFAQRLPSRAAAARELMRRGLSVAGHSRAEAGDSSRAFGVIDSPLGTGMSRAR